ncbi:S-adenosyl-L-methionine-dependent methyltransferase [Lentinula aciculospora]|uniref:S-adenosyl-L-methionine-dependent methyltransferase n=1 Tax=Lentinula aciculospora TaxID=153920 RepID=A0A9W9DY01_9AGAR|nr:S-adenosyl-L-methionine-dependent methyltransferase [Lentinula aciculospora]
MSTNQVDPLKALIDIITAQTTVLQSAYSNNNLQVPSIDVPFQSTPLEFNPVVTASRHLIVAAALQLIATVQSPIEFIQGRLGGIYDTATLGLLVDINVPEILKEAGPQGLHVNKLSSATNVDSSYLARVLRYLATRHIFKEVSPDVFAHNRLSSLLNKAKSMEEIEENPIGRFDNAPLAAFIRIASDELLNASTAFTSFIKNPQQASAPFNIAYNTPKKMWEWTEEPGREVVSRRFTSAIKDTARAMYPPEIFTSGLDGNILQPNDVIVDVGGGVGSVTLTLQKAYPDLRYVVQDLEQQIVAARKFWDENNLRAITTGQVQLQAHDFFKPQPVKDAAVYFLRQIIHDWPDEEYRKILTNLRSAAGAHSKLVLFEMLAKHVTEDLDSGPSAPYPLLPNPGVGQDPPQPLICRCLLTMYNGKERTYEEYTQLGKESGWKLEEVRPGKLSAFIFIPI